MSSLSLHELARHTSLCVTARLELVIFDSMCLAVRDRQSGLFLEDHSAIDERVTLEPQIHNDRRLASFQLIVHTFGLRLVIGPVLAVRRAPVEVCEHITQHASLRRLARALEARGSEDAPARKVA